jgi:ABC-type dipeptide/oligopeptide/nickel transport system ATPase component
MRDLLSRINTFEGNLEDALVHAGPLDGPLDIPGIPIAITDDSAKSRVGSDFTLLRYLDGQISNKAIGIIADQGVGKTFALNCLMNIWAHEDAGIYTGSIQLDSLKHNNLSEPETVPLITNMLGCEVIQVSKMSLNPLSRVWDMTYDEQYIMVKIMIQVRRQQKLTDGEEELLHIYLDESYHDQANRPSFERLAARINSFRAKRDEYAEDGTLVEQGYTDKQAEYLEKQALDLSSAIRNLTRGEFRKIFTENADDERLLKLISQKAKSWDFKYVSDDARSVIEIFRGMIEMSASQLKDPEDPTSGPKHPERVAQYIGWDEAYNAFGNAEFREFAFLLSKTLRERDITLVTCFHRLVDFLESVGSAKARNFLREIPIWLIGRQSKADLPNLREFFHLPEHVLQGLPTLPKGRFWLIVPGRAPRLITIIGTEEEIVNFVTNQANETLLQQYLETGELQYYMRYLDETSPPVKEEELEQAESETPEPVAVV